MSYIFISYSRKDLGLAEVLVEGLKKNGFEIWIDWNSIPKGEQLSSEITQGIEKCAAFIFLISPHSVDSRWCNLEIDEAVKNGKKILPLIIADTDPASIRKEISDINWIAFNQVGPNLEEQIKEIGQILRTDFWWLKFLANLQAKALNWERTGDSSRLLYGKELHDTEKTLAENEGTQEKKATSLQHLYIYESRQSERKFRNRLALAGTLAGVILIIASVIAILQRNSAVRNAEVNQSLALSAYAQNAAIQNDQDLALALAMESVQIENPPQQAISQLTQIAFDEGTRNVIPVNQEFGVFRVAISPDGKRILSVSGAGDIQLWDFQTAREIRRIGDHGNYDGSLDPLIPGVAFSPDSHIAVTAGAEDVRFWDLESGTLIRKIFLGKRLGLNAAKFSQDTHYLLWGSSDGSVNFWDLSTGKEIVRLIDEKPVTLQSVDLNSNNTMALAGTEDGRVILWDLEAGSKIREFRIQLERYSGQSQGVYVGVAFTSDDRYVAGAISSGAVEIWDIDSGQLIQHFDSQQIMGAVRFSLDDKYLLVPTGKSIDIWDIETGQLAHQLLGHTGWVEDARFSNDNSHIVSGSLDGTMRIWELISETSSRFDGHTSRVTSLSLSPDGASLLSSSWDGSTRLWDLNTGETIQKVKAETNSKMRSAVFSPDGKYFLSAEDLLVQLFEFDGTEPVLQVTGVKTMLPASIGFLPDGKSFFTASIFGDTSLLDAPDSTIQIRDTASGRIQQEIFDRGVTEYLGAVAPSPDGKYIVGASSFSSTIATYADTAVNINIWDLAKKEKVRSVPLSSTSDLVTGMTINPDSDRIAIGTATGSVLIIDLHTGDILKRIAAHSDTVGGLAFSHDGRFLGSASSDGTIKIWNTWDWTENTNFTTQNSSFVTSLIFDANDSRIIGGTDSGLIFSWWINEDLVSTLKWIRGNRYIRPFSCAERIEYHLELQCDKDGNPPAQDIAIQTAAPSQEISATPTKLSLESSAVVDPGSLLTQKVSGQLDESPALYSFEAQAGSRLSLLMESEQFDGYLILKDADGKPVQMNDDGLDDQANNSLLSNIEIRKTGTYYIIVDSFLRNTYFEKGGYDLTLTIQGQSGLTAINIQPCPRGLFGMVFSKTLGEALKVDGVYSEASAAMAGVHAGDRIVSINGVETATLTERQVWDLMLVPPEISLDLVVLHLDNDHQQGKSSVTMTSALEGSGSLLYNHTIEPGIKEYGSVEQQQSMLWEFLGHKGQEFVVTIGGMEIFTGDMQILAGDGSLLQDSTFVDNRLGNLLFTPRLAMNVETTQDGPYYISISDSNQRVTAGEASYTLALQPLVHQGNLPTPSTVQGELSATDGMYWNFSAKAGQIINFILELHDSQVEPFVILVAPDGTIVGKDGLDGFDKFTNKYDYEKYPDALGVMGYPLPQSGEYKLLILPYLRMSPVQQAGTYTLSFEVQDIKVQEMLEDGKPITTNLDASVLKTFGYDGKKNETIRVTVTANNPASREETYFAAVEKNLLDTYLIVLDPNNSVLIGNDDFDGTTNSQIEMTLPEDGRYVFEVGTLRNFGKGKFSILVEILK